MEQIKTLPPQQLSFAAKNVSWRKKHLDWADNHSSLTNTKIRKTIAHKKINYDLVDGILNLNDCAMILNPDSIDASYIPENIQHYPTINSKINILRGEEISRRFEYRAICTNPAAISSIEEAKTKEMYDAFKLIIENTAQSEEELKIQLEKLQADFIYSWQDIREIRANALLSHYMKEFNMQQLFNNGFMDAITVGEEIYQCKVVSGEPIIEKLNPLKVRIFKSGYSNKIEDADIIVIEDFWSPGKIIDHFYESLKDKDIKYIERLPSTSDATEMDNYDETKGFVRGDQVDGGTVIDNYLLFTNSNTTSGYYDSDGNIKVLQVFWKSRRKIKKVKSYDPETGEEVYNIYPETYIINSALGEEEEIFWINEAWSGVKIGKDIYTEMKPCAIQYNRIYNPSRCHFGIVGSVYNSNDGKPFALVDAMKPYAYLYDVIHDRLNKAIAANWGIIMELDLASVPKGWDIDKWMYYAKINHIAVKDSFKEGNIGAATGKLAGAMANNSRGMIGADTGNYIQQHINLLEFIKMEMAEAVGISKQREGQISHTETVGGVERATLQSSHITEWLFSIHNDVKKRVLECFLETAKHAMKGRSKKFQYILSDMTAQLIEIDGDEFSENDYGIVVDNSPQTQELASKLDMLAQAALQNQMLDFSTIMKIYSNTSLAETQRLIEKSEAERKKAAQEAQVQQSQIEEAKLQQQLSIEQQKLQAEKELQLMKQEHEVRLKQIELQAKMMDNMSIDTEESKEELLEKMRQFDEQMSLDRERLALERKVAEDNKVLKEQEIAVKKIAANKKPNTTKS